jgi:hypothetical protein
MRIRSFPAAAQLVASLFVIGVVPWSEASPAGAVNRIQAPLPTFDAGSQGSLTCRPSQPGSLLVFPLVDNINAQTIVEIVNGADEAVWLQGVAVVHGNDSTSFLKEDFLIHLTAKEPFFWNMTHAYNRLDRDEVRTQLRSYAGMKGFCFVWAVSDNHGQRETAWDHLIGDALIYNAAGQAFAYNAYPHQARKIVRDRILNLDGIEYCQAPSQIMTQGFSAGLMKGLNGTLAICALDIDFIESVQPEFDINVSIYNQDETYHSRHLHCYQFAQFDLANDLKLHVSQVFTPKWQLTAMATRSARPAIGMAGGGRQPLWAVFFQSVGGMSWEGSISQHPGSGASTCVVLPNSGGTDADGDGWLGLTGEDCDDSDPAIYPGAPEICDGKDNDCDGLVDDADPDAASRTAWYPDADRDAFGDAGAVPILSCMPQPGFVADHSDCDDNDPAIHPGAVEICDGIDNDCNGAIDDNPACLDADGDGIPDVMDNCPTVANADQADADGDGIGDACDPCPNIAGGADADHDGWCSGAGGDCNDDDATIYPGAPELCDGLDNDCNGAVDDNPACLGDADGDGIPDVMDNCPTVANADQADADGDGIGDACDPCPNIPGGADADHDGWCSGAGGDCNDDDATIYPGAPELCDGLDNDCNGAVDDNPVCFVDADGDGWTVSGGDCDDADAAIHPGAPEVCDGKDNDCDGMMDEGICDDGDPCTIDFCQAGACMHVPDPTCDADMDGDGWSIRNGDCDDMDPTVHPGAPEVCDGIDNDCNGQVDEGC